MKIRLLNEPVVEFGNGFICDDPKMGLSMGGFYSSTANNHRTEIHYSVIATKENAQDLFEWIKELENHITAEATEIKVGSFEINDGEVIVNEQDEFAELFADETEEIIEQPSFEINHQLNPDFPGIGIDSIFKCNFVNDESNNRFLKSAKLEEILNEETEDLDKAVKYCEIIINYFNDILENTISAKPNICFLIIPDSVFKELASIKIKNKYFNLRRYIKAQLISVPNSIPVQIIKESTLTRSGKKKIQDKSMVAWNFLNACYYKNEGTPWSLDLEEKNTCFIGISFNKVIQSEDNNVRASIAQAFNYQGKGLVFIGKQFEWDPHKNNTPSPHLTYEYAKDLISHVLKEYNKFNKTIPTRVVIHKTTDYWTGSINSNYAEVEGLKKGILDALGDDIELDLITVKTSDIKLLRGNGEYPVMRGTMLEIDRKTAILYTTGYIPYYETYPGMHVPHPIEVIKFEGETPIIKICEEVLALTKLNFNNCNYYDGLPITIRFAQKVGEIIQYFDEEQTTAPNKYFYYM